MSKFSPSSTCQALTSSKIEVQVYQTIFSFRLRLSDNIQSSHTCKNMSQRSAVMQVVIPAAQAVLPFQFCSSFLLLLSLPPALSCFVSAVTEPCCPAFVAVHVYCCAYLLLRTMCTRRSRTGVGFEVSSHSSESYKVT